MIDINTLTKLRHEMEGVADKIVEELRKHIPLVVVTGEDAEEDDGLTVGDTYSSERESKLIDLTGADEFTFEDLSACEILELVCQIEKTQWLLEGDVE